MYQVEHNIVFVLRAVFKSQPFRFVTYAFFSGMVIFGFALRIMEAPLSRNVNDMSHWPYASCLWEAVVTMTTGTLFLKFALFSDSFSGIRRLLP